MPTGLASTLIRTIALALGVLPGCLLGTWTTPAQAKPIPLHFAVRGSVYGNLTSAMQNMADASKDTQQFKGELAKLTGNLASLNNVYGSMLTAMRGGNQ